MKILWRTVGVIILIVFALFVLKLLKIERSPILSRTTSTTSAISNTYPLGSSEHSLVVDGHMRTYTIYIPKTAGGVALPLVVMLHGGYGTGVQAEKAYGWDAIADQYGIAVAYPDGYQKSWNAGTCCGPAVTDKIDDVGFIKNLIASIETQTPIDTRRVYATGISNGGMMAYRLACELPGIFAAIGPDAASMTVSCTDPSPQPISILHIQGLADQDVPFNGGHGTKGTATISYTSIPDVIHFWENVDQCPAPISTTSGLITTSSTICTQGTSVELVTIAGAGHQWPGSTAISPVIDKILGVDPPSTALDATKTFWNFFQQHSL